MGTIKRYEISFLSDLTSVIGLNAAVGFIGSLDVKMEDDKGNEYTATLLSGAVHSDSTFAGSYYTGGVRLTNGYDTIKDVIDTGYIYIYSNRLTNRTLLRKECA